MKSVRKFPKALKLFAKEVGAPVSIIADSHKCHKPKEVKQFYIKISTTLRILECGTQWENMVELYVGMFKESARKDMSDEDSPMVFWDYCAERRSSITNINSKYIF